MTALFAVLIWVGACASLLGFFTYAASRWYIDIYILLVRADQIGAQPPLRTLLRSMHFLWIGASGFVGCLSIYCVLKFWPIALFVELPAAVLFLLIAGLGAWLTRAALHHQHLRKVIRAIDYLLVVSVCLGLLGAIAALLLTSMEIASPRQAASPIHAILQISTPVAVVFSALSAGLGLYAFQTLVLAKTGKVYLETTSMLLGAEPSPLFLILLPPLHSSGMTNLYITLLTYTSNLFLNTLYGKCVPK